MSDKRYPKILIGSKNELAKRISHKGFTHKDALRLINNARNNFDKYWKDSSKSDPVKGKYVRNAKYTPLGILLEKINDMVLAPHDKLLPNFIFGGVSGSNHVKAAKSLLGKKRMRTLIKLDIQGFFEQISSKHVMYLFQDKCKCGSRAARLLSSLCCVPIGPKGSGNVRKTIGRGFATSSRLAVWCNLETFIGLNHIVQRRLKNRDARIAIYVDDIGITASRVSKEDMEKIAEEAKQYLSNSAPNQPLALNDNKTKIVSHSEGMEILGQRLNRNTLSIGGKTVSKLDRIKAKLEKDIPPEESGKLRNQERSLKHYKRYVSNA